MPTYDYECTECEHKFEVFQSITEAKRVKVCPKCGKMKANRLIGAGGGVIFKGAGFYTTDYRSKKYIEDSQYAKRQERKAERCGNKSICK